MSGSKESLYERLRAATRPLHDELEGAAVRIGERSGRKRVTPPT